MFNVGRSTCPQCLDGGVSRIQPFDLYIDVNTNQTHYAWQAGVRSSSFNPMGLTPPVTSFIFRNKIGISMFDRSRLASRSHENITNAFCF